MCEVRDKKNILNQKCAIPVQTKTDVKICAWERIAEQILNGDMKIKYDQSK